MRRIYFRFFSEFLRSKYILFACYILGLLFSFIAASSAGEALLSAMRMVSLSHVSIIGLLCSLLIPVFISAYAVYSNESWIIPILSFLKAFAFGYCAYAIMAAFQTAGWLVCYLVMFSDINLLCVLWWFWLRQYPQGDRRLGTCTMIAVAAASMIGILDYLLIAPFWLVLHQ